MWERRAWGRGIALGALASVLLPRAARSAPPAARFRGRRIDIELQDVDVHEAFEIFAELGNVNIVPQQGISGRVTLRMKDQPWDYCLCLIVETLGLSMERDANVIYVRKA